jgi:ABC-type multidrug transport system ATPase subunit
MPEWSLYFRMMFELLPSFHFNKLFCDVTRVTCFHMSFEGMLWVPGRPWESDDFFREVKGQFMTKDRYLVPSMYSSMVKILQVSLGYFLLALYFDNIFAENRGTSQPFYFFLKPSYWFKACSRQALASSQLKSPRSRSSSFSSDTGHHKTTNTASDERKSVKEAESEALPNPGVRIIGLSKTYQGRKTWCKTGPHSKYQSVKALKDVYLEVSEGELLGIMGHNGAGKTTLVNTMCGYVQLTSGNARVFERHLNRDLESIRRRMGVVSQFDVLWDELTATDHMYLVSQIKRVSYKDHARFFNERLREVGLLESANLAVGKYSGGMRRRMSVALSTIGEPKVILMDEPTTGMDPVSRRQVWDLIQKMKKNRVMIMTTHAMEEAELLSDKLAVLNHGEVSCVGTPLQLKNLLGKGYRVSLVCDRKQIGTVKGLFKTVVPSAEFYETSGDSGSLVYNVPLDKVRELSNVFKLIDCTQMKVSNPDEENE